jgi:hypothetical protein
MLKAEIVQEDGQFYCELKWDEGTRYPNAWGWGEDRGQALESALLNADLVRFA